MSTYKITKTINGYTDTLPHRIHNEQSGKLVLEDIRRNNVGMRTSYDGIGLYCTDTCGNVTTYKLVRG